MSDPAESDAVMTREAARLMPMRGMIVAAALWLEKRRQRHALRDLDDDRLRDIGISRCEARRESGRSFGFLGRWLG
ncbi:MAG: DUF1127 domain-containing protein [Mesorhizobium sp.]